MENQLSGTGTDSVDIISGPEAENQEVIEARETKTLETVLSCVLERPNGIQITEAILRKIGFRGTLERIQQTEQLLIQGPTELRENSQGHESVNNADGESGPIEQEEEQDEASPLPVEISSKKAIAKRVKGLPEPLHVFAGKGRHSIIVTQLFLVIGAGTMSNLSLVIVKPEGVEYPISIGGPWTKSIDRTMRFIEIGETDQPEPYLETHPLDRLYFARIFSFVPGHLMDDPSRYDITAKIDSSIMSLHTDVRRHDFLGTIPTLNGKPTDFIVQQGDRFFGFNVDVEEPDFITCDTIMKSHRLRTIHLQMTKDDRMPGLLAWMTKAVDLEHVFVKMAPPKSTIVKKDNRPVGARGATQNVDDNGNDKGNDRPDEAPRLKRRR